MCKQPSFQCSFYGFKGGKFWAWSGPIFIPSTFLGVISRVNLHTTYPCLVWSFALQDFSKTSWCHSNIYRSIELRSQCNFAAASTTFRKPIWRLWNFEYCQLWQLEHVQSHDSKPVARGEPLIRQPNFSAAIWHQKCVVSTYKLSWIFVRVRKLKVMGEI